MLALLYADHPERSRWMIQYWNFVEMTMMAGECGMGKTPELMQHQYEDTMMTLADLHIGGGNFWK
jgi:hypothetical protein